MCLVLGCAARLTELLRRVRQYGGELRFLRDGCDGKAFGNLLGRLVLGHPRVKSGAATHCLRVKGAKTPFRCGNRVLATLHPYPDWSLHRAGRLRLGDRAAFSPPL
jgi:hypothetical protein